MKEPARVLNSYNGDDMLNRYARSIAAFRLPDLGRALEDIDSLIIEYPQDPYFHELKGQMLFENGRIDASVPPYEESVRLRPDAALLRIGLARALIETGSAADNQAAIGHLHEASPPGGQQRQRVAPPRNRPGTRGPGGLVVLVLGRVRALGRQPRRCSLVCQTRRGQDPTERPGVVASARRPAGDRGELRTRASDGAMATQAAHGSPTVL